MIICILRFLEEIKLIVIRKKKIRLLYILAEFEADNLFLRFRGYQSRIVSRKRRYFCKFQYCSKSFHTYQLFWAIQKYFFILTKGTF